MMHHPLPVCARTCAAGHHRLEVVFEEKAAVEAGLGGHAAVALGVAKTAEA